MEGAAGPGRSSPAKEGVAVLALLAAAALLVQGAGASLERYRPACNLEPPPVGAFAPPAEAAPARRARRVLFVLLDGLRVDVARELPFLRQLARAGVDGEATSEYPTSSLPNYACLGSGAPPEITGIMNNASFAPFVLDTVAARAKAAGLSTALLGPPHSGMQRVCGSDLDAVLQLAPTVSLPDGDLVLFVTVEIDETGHGFGALSPEHRSAALHADRQLRSLVGGLDLRRDAVVVSADHGRVDSGGHGGMEPEVRTVPLVLAGAGIRAGARPRGARVVDVAPTLAALLGLPAPRQSMGRVLTELLELHDDESRELAHVDGLRRAALGARLEVWRGAQADVAARIRLLRLLASLVALAGAGALLRAAHRSGVVHLSAAGLAAAAAPFLATSAMAFWAHGLRLSPSHGPTRTHLEEQAFGYGAALLVIAAASYLLARHERATRARLRWRLGSASLAMLLALVLAGAGATFLWPPYPTGLPSPRVVALVNLSCAVVAASVAIHAAVLALDALLVATRPVVRYR